MIADSWGTTGFHYLVKRRRFKFIELLFQFLIELKKSNLHPYLSPQAQCE